jgi:hypothetical protein
MSATLETEPVIVLRETTEIIEARKEVGACYGEEHPLTQSLRVLVDSQIDYPESEVIAVLKGQEAELVVNALVLRCLQVTESDGEAWQKAQARTILERRVQTKSKVSSDHPAAYNLVRRSRV